MGCGGPDRRAARWRRVGQGRASAVSGVQAFTWAASAGVSMSTGVSPAPDRAERRVLDACLRQMEAEKHERFPASRYATSARLEAAKKGDSAALVRLVSMIISCRPDFCVPCQQGIRLRGDTRMAEEWLIVVEVSGLWEPLGPLALNSPACVGTDRDHATFRIPESQYPGISSRHCMIAATGRDEVSVTPLDGSEVRHASSRERGWVDIAPLHQSTRAHVGDALYLGPLDEGITLVLVRVDPTSQAWKLADHDLAPPLGAADSLLRPTAGGFERPRASDLDIERPIVMSNPKGAWPHGGRPSTGALIARFAVLLCCFALLLCSVLCCAVQAWSTP